MTMIHGQTTMTSDRTRLRREPVVDEVRKLRLVRKHVWIVPLALILAEIVGWSIRYRDIIPTIQFFTGGVAALARVGQRSTASLEQLKDVREKVRDGIDAQRAPKKRTSTGSARNCW